MQCLTREGAVVRCALPAPSLLNELWGNVVIPIMDAQVPGVMNQAFQDALDPPDGSPSQMPAFIKDLRVVNFKLGNAPPQVHSVCVPEGNDDGKLPPGDLIVETNYTFDSDDMDISVLLEMTKSEMKGNLAQAGLDASHTQVASGTRASRNTGIIIKVDKIKFDACLRFRVRPGAKMCFIGLAKVPEVILALTATFKTFAGIQIPIKLTRLPGVQGALENLIQAETRKTIVWPRYIPLKLTPTAGHDVPVEGPAASDQAASPDTASVRSARGSQLKSPGTKFYTIDRRMRSPTGGTLMVTVIEARNLAALHREGQIHKKATRAIRRGIEKLPSFPQNAKASPVPADSSHTNAEPATDTLDTDDEDITEDTAQDSREELPIDHLDEQDDMLESPNSSTTHGHKKLKFFSPIVSVTSSSGTAFTSPGVKPVDPSVQPKTEGPPKDVFHWHDEYGEDGETINVEVRSGTMFSVEFYVASGRNNASRIGSALIHVEWLSNGDTLFYGTDSSDRPYVRRASIKRTASARRAGQCDFWIPLEKVDQDGGLSCIQNQDAAVRVRLEMDWNYRREATTSLRSISTNLTDESTAATELERKAMIIQRAVRKYMDKAADRRSAELAIRQGMVHHDVLVVSGVELWQSFAPKRIRLKKNAYFLRAMYAGQERRSEGATVVESEGLRRMTFPNTILEWLHDGDTGTIEIEICKHAEPISAGNVSVGRVIVDIGELDNDICKHETLTIETRKGGHIELQLGLTRLIEYRLAAP